MALSQLATLVTASVTSQFDELRKFLERTSVALAKVPDSGRPAVDIDALYEQATQPFSIFVCGEFNSGKSSLINVLVGQEVASVGVLPTTTSITPYTSPAIRSIQIVDSPGLNSVIADHQALTERFVERSDFILFVTSVERPLTHSETQFLGWVRETWRRKLIVVLNKAELLSAADLAQVQQFVKNGCANILSEVPQLFTVSTRDRSGIDQLIGYLNEGLGERERQKLKFQAPLFTLLVHLNALREANTGEIDRLREELSVFEAVRERAKRRVEEAGLLFEAFSERAQRCFAELAETLEYEIEEKIGFLKMLQARITGKTQRLSHLVAGIVHDQDISRKLTAIVGDAAEKVDTYRKIVFEDTREYLEGHGASALSESVKLLEVNPGLINIQEISEQLQKAAEKGMTRFFAYGSAAAATGIGAKLAVAASIEVTGVVLMAILAVLSVRAFPRERLKVQRAIKGNIISLGRGFAASLDENIRGCLDHSVRLMLASFEPRVSSLRTELAQRIEHDKSVSALIDEAQMLSERAF